MRGLVQKVPSMSLPPEKLAFERCLLLSSKTCLLLSLGLGNRYNRSHHAYTSGVFITMSTECLLNAV